jgi:hypothetical protein
MYNVFIRIVRRGLAGNGWRRTQPYDAAQDKFVAVSSFAEIPVTEFSLFRKINWVIYGWEPMSD